MAYSFSTPSPTFTRRENHVRRFVAAVTIISFVIFVVAHAAQMLSAGGADIWQRVEQNAAIITAVAICALILRGMVRGLQRTAS